MEPPFHNAPFFILKKAKNENILINTISVSYTHLDVYKRQLEQGATVITGANMGGKSVSMKSLTLNLLLAQTGFFAFAKAFSAPLFDSVSRCV